jgi:four helix bundle protein
MNDLSDRLFVFSVKTIEYIRNLPDNPEYKIIKYQLTKSATSSGANYEESQAGSSKADFINKVRISLREMRESNYWLRLLKAIGKNNKNDKELKFLIKESNELKNILGAIVKKTR